MFIAFFPTDYMSGYIICNKPIIHVLSQVPQSDLFGVLDEDP